MIVEGIAPFEGFGENTNSFISYLRSIYYRKHMARTFFSFLLISYAFAGFAQNKDIPALLQVPQGSKLIMHTYAKGVQIYLCKQDSKDTSRYIWTFIAPHANLYDDSRYHHLVGKHYFDAGKNPMWEAADGSTVVGLKVQQANSPDSLAIPWLLLKMAATTGNGILTPVAFIQRIYTKGGKAPATADRQHAGQTVEVPYTAEYLFYSGH